YIATGAWKKWNIDAARYMRELIPPADYLRMSYYEKWYAGLVDLLVKRGLVATAEVDSGKPAAGSNKATPALTAEQGPTARHRGASTSRDIAVAARFQAGQKVRARVINPTG